MANCPYCENPFPAMQSVLGRSEIHPCAKCRNPVMVRADATETTAEPIPGVRDIREDCPTESVGGMILSVLHKSRYRLPLLPQVSACLARTLESEEHVPDIAFWDPIVVANLLRAANGDLFGGLERLGSARAAVERLGVERTRDVLQSLVEDASFAMQEPHLADAIGRTWRNSVFAGAAARELGRAHGEQEQENLSSIGLLHDIGKFLILDAIESGVGDSVDAVRSAPRLLADTVARFHHLCSLHLADRWRMPIRVAMASFAYENIDVAREDAYRHAAHLAAFTHDLAASSGYGDGTQQVATLLAHQSNRYLRTSDVEIARIRIDVSDELTEAFARWDMAPVEKIA